MGVFQRKVDQSMSPPLRANVRRKSSIDKRRFSHPQPDGLDTEKWPPTLPPGPEVVEADPDDSKGSVKADEFQSWAPEGLPGGSGFISSAPNLSTPSSSPLGQSSSSQFGFVLSDPGVPTVPPPRPRTRTSKDPYAKRKAKFEQKPKLAPITESEMDSRRSSQASGGSHRNSQVSMGTPSNVVNGEKPTVAPRSNVVNNGQESVGTPSNVVNNEPASVITPTNVKSNNNQVSVSTPSDHDPYEPVEVRNGVMTKSDDMVEYINSGSIHGSVPNGISGSKKDSTSDVSTPFPEEPKNNNDTPPNGDSDAKRSSGEGNLDYENVVIGMDGSMESLAVGYIPAKVNYEADDRETLKQLEEWRQSKPRPKPKPEIDFNMQTDMPSVPDDTYDNMKNHSRHFAKKADDITDSQTIDTGVGTDMDDMQGSDNKAFEVDEDFMLEIEAATGMLDEVVFGKGRSTQTGDSLRLAHDRSNLMIQAMNRANRPISDCVVVDSGTSMDDLNPRPSVKPVVMRKPTVTQPQPQKASITTSTSTESTRTTGVPSIIPPPLQKKKEEVDGSKERIIPKESPSRSTPSPVPTKMDLDGTDSILTSFSEEPPRRQSRKMCIAMSIIFIVIILGIIAAGVIVYFVVVQTESGGDKTMKSFYLGIDLRGRIYSPDLMQSSSNEYSFMSSEICTYVKASFENTVWAKAYQSCEIMDYRQASTTLGIAAHVQMAFLKSEVTKREEEDVTTSEVGLRYYLVKCLTSKSQGMEFNRLYLPDTDTMRIVKFWSQLSDFGTKPTTR